MPRPGCRRTGRSSSTTTRPSGSRTARTTPPFTKGVTQAIEEWSEDAANQNKDLGEATGHAGTHREGDRARGLGWQHGVTDDRTDERPPRQGCAQLPAPSLCQPPGQQAYEVSMTGSYRHIGPGSSEFCWDIRTVPPRPNAQVTVRTQSGPSRAPARRPSGSGPQPLEHLRRVRIRRKYGIEDV
jgi:hypothetical protein